MSANSTDYDLIRSHLLYEWTFAVLVTNLTLNAYRFGALLISLVFDLFKLVYSKKTYGPLSDNDLRPYSRYFTPQYELIFQLAESLILVVAAYYNAKSLLVFSTLGLSLTLSVFMVHVIILILGVIFLNDGIQHYLSVEFLLWLVVIATEFLSVLLSAVAIAGING